MISPVRTALLDHAQRLIRTHGYNGFSYRDLSAQVGVKTSSIHYHFPTKSDLALAAVEAYSDQVFRAVAGIDSTLPPLQRLARYEALVEAAAEHGNLSCLCGMLAAEISGLPEPVRQAVRHYYLWKEQWLENLLREAVDAGELQYRGDLSGLARTLYAAYQGCSPRPGCSKSADVSVTCAVRS